MNGLIFHVKLYFMIHLLFLLKKGVGNIFQVHINGLIFYVIG